MERRGEYSVGRSVSLGSRFGRSGGPAVDPGLLPRLLDDMGPRTGILLVRWDRLVVEALDG